MAAQLLKATVKKPKPNNIRVQIRGIGVLPRVYVLGIWAELWVAERRHWNLPRSVKSYRLTSQPMFSFKGPAQCYWGAPSPGLHGLPQHGPALRGHVRNAVLCENSLKASSSLFATWKGILSSATQCPEHCRAKAKPADTWQTECPEDPHPSLPHIFLEYF